METIGLVTRSPYGLPDTLQRLAVYHGKRARTCSATLRKLEHLEIPGEFVRRAIQNYASG